MTTKLELRGANDRHGHRAVAGLSVPDHGARKPPDSPDVPPRPEKDPEDPSDPRFPEKRRAPGAKPDPPPMRDPLP